MTYKVTSYHQLQAERDQQIALDASADGHDAVRLQGQRRAPPTYPQQPPHSPWSGDPVPPEPPTGELIDAVRDVSKVDR
jgi:hypothetical protein